MAVCCVCNKVNVTLPDSLIQCAKCKFYVHKECYGTKNSYPSYETWLCQRCTLGAGNERCQLCPFGEGALKKTDNGGWAHILCAQYIPEVIFGDNYSMEPINLAEVPKPRFQQKCYICDEKKEDVAMRQGACMQCNVQNCINCFHVTCGQKAGLLVAEDCENRRIVDYYGFCNIHVKHTKTKIKTEGLIKKTDKLPAVETLTSQHLKEVTKLLPNIANAPKTLPLDPSATFKPVQPKVHAQPLPFQGVHKQDSIIDTSPQDGAAEVKKEEIPISSTTTSSKSTPPPPADRKLSSETDTADSEDLGSEPIIKTMQSIGNGEKTKLKISRQSGPDLVDSEGAQYNDLFDIFSKKSKKKKYKSPDSEMSDYLPYTERKRNTLHKKGKRGKMKKDPLRIRSLKNKIKSPKYSHNSYLYKSPPKTPVKVQKTELVNGDQGYSPTSIVSKMIEETNDSPVEDYKPCTGKPIISLDTFFDRFKEMGQQYIQDRCRSERSRDLLVQLQELNQVNSYLSNKIKAKSAKLEQLRCLKRRLGVPYAKSMRGLPEPVPISRAVSKLLSTVHKPPQYRKDVIIAETWTEDKEETEDSEVKEIDPSTLSTLTTPTQPKPITIEEVANLPVPTSMTALVKPPHDKQPPTPTDETLPAGAVPTETPQIIIAGDPPMAYTCKDGALVPCPEAVQSSLSYNKALEEQYKVVEQHYKEKISAAYYEAQRRQYEGLLQHQMQSRQANDYLTQAYLTDQLASYYYAQQHAATGRPMSSSMPSLTAHFPANPPLPQQQQQQQQQYGTLPARPPVSRT